MDKTSSTEAETSSIDKRDNHTHKFTVPVEWAYTQDADKTGYTNEHILSTIPKKWVTRLKCEFCEEEVKRI